MSGGRAGDLQTDSLHEQNLLLQRRSRIERRRRRLAELRMLVLPPANEIEQLENEIRAEGEGP